MEIGHLATPGGASINTFFQPRKDPFTCKQHYKRHIGPRLSFPSDDGRRTRPRSGLSLWQQTLRPRKLTISPLSTTLHASKYYLYTQCPCRNGTFTCRQHLCITRGHGHQTDTPTQRHRRHLHRCPAPLERDRRWFILFYKAASPPLLSKELLSFEQEHLFSILSNSAHSRLVLRRSTQLTTLFDISRDIQEVTGRRWIKQSTAKREKWRWVT